jgi:EutQ-like cupin domain
VSFCPAPIGLEAAGTKSKVKPFIGILGGDQPMISRIEVAHTAVDLTPSPIEPSWIIKGNPVAQSALLTKSSDGLAWTMVWQCSEGSFHWHYDLDETILILKGRGRRAALTTLPQHIPRLAIGSPAGR